ncbi:hypothetical protein ElyMa_003221400 [Elysia marginata]|uniref:Uncharacterized protein n=1 Tax=Elysia marginata TaxID=1093978 RepID=A0AAV4J1L8_9GAST|nr:hypothetical protein ElyMa_003221400 [Elysia marginata]
MCATLRVQGVDRGPPDPNNLIEVAMYGHDGPCAEDFSKETLGAKFTAVELGVLCSSTSSIPHPFSLPGPELVDPGLEGKVQPITPVLSSRHVIKARNSRDGPGKVNSSDVTANYQACDVR